MVVKQRRFTVGGSIGMEGVMRKVEVKELRLRVEELEQRIAPSVHGTGGYDGQPGGQCSAKHNPTDSANPEKTSS
jgi:hypothetical protein